jgi:O-antigen ligase
MVLVALIWSILLRDPLVLIWSSFPLVQLASAIVMIVLPGVFLLVANNINSLKLLKVMVGIMLFAGVLGLIKRYWLGSLPINAEGLFTMWVISLSTGLALFNHELSWLKRSALLALAGGFTYWGFGMNISWLGGWLPGFIALGTLGFLRSKKLSVILAIAVVVLIALDSDYYLGTVLQNENNESGLSRLAAWEVNWRVTGKHLLFGTGPAGYAVYYMSYFPHEGMATHSNYIDVLAQIGIIGFAFYVWFFLILAWQGYKLCRRLKGRGDFSEALACAALAGTISCIVAMGFGDWLFPFAYTQTIAGFDHAVYSWLFMGTIVALNHIVDRGSTESGLLTKA